MVENTENSTEDQLLNTILRQSDFTKDHVEEPIQEQPEVPTPSEADEVNDQEVPEVSESEEVVEEPTEVVEEEVVEETPEESAIYDVNDLEDFSVNIKIDGEDKAVNIKDLVKGYATDQSLSQKGRELGDARKALDEERAKKIGEIDNVMGAANQLLLKSENQHAKEYKDLKEQIAKAREEGDTYTVQELKDKQDMSQEKYWAARNEREMLVGKAEEQRQEVLNEAFTKQLESFNKGIKEVIPTWSDETAVSVREYALNKNIPEEFLNYVTDVNIVKFVHDAMLNDQARSKGSVKRQAVKVKPTIAKKSTPISEKKVAAEQANRNKVLSGEGSKEDQDAFLKNLVSRHFE